MHHCLKLHSFILRGWINTWNRKAKLYKYKYKAVRVPFVIKYLFSPSIIFSLHIVSGSEINLTGKFSSIEIH